MWGLCLSVVGLLVGGLVLAAPAPAAATVLYAKREALAVAFPEAEVVEPQSFFLTDAQRARVQTLAHAPLAAKVVTFYVGRAGERVLGYGFIETLIVRTLPATFLIVVSPAGQVARILTLAFYEPLEYRPAPGWLAQFGGRGLPAELQRPWAIHGIAGATLTARGVTRGVRKVLALFEVVLGRPEGGERACGL